MENSDRPNQKGMSVLLSEVFEILAKRYADEKNPDRSYKEDNVESLPWKRQADRPIHPMTGILKCRLVSKSWNVAIENLFEDKRAGHYASGLNRPNGIYLNQFTEQNFGSACQPTPQMFIEHFEKNSRGHFF